MINNRNLRKRALSHIHGIPNENSSDEIRMYRIILKNLRDCPNPQYDFHFNKPITEFGVPSKSIRIQDHREQFVDYLMTRCFVDRIEANELADVVGAPIRTNTLRLDIGKTNLDGDLVVGLESNRDSHYVIPDSYDDRIAFARSVFADMVKEVEIGKISTLIELNRCVDDIYGIGSEESVEQVTLVNAFLSAN